MREIVYRFPGGNAPKGRKSDTKRLLTLLLVLLLALTLPAAALAEQTAEFGVPAEDYTGKLVILHTNDVHGAVDGYAVVAALKRSFAERGAEVLLVDAGDFSQGILLGRDDGRLDPHGGATRAETAVLLSRLLNLFELEQAA